MSLLLRMIVSTSPWIEAEKKEGGLAASAESPPIWAVREFMPSEKDGSGLSVYEVKNEDEAELIAAAYSIHKSESAKNAVIFIALDRAAVETAGLVIRETAGDWHHVFADAQHREIIVDDMGALTRLAAVALTGEMFNFEHKSVWKAVRSQAQLDQYKFFPLARKGGSSPAALNIVKFIGEEIVIASGAR